MVGLIFFNGSEKYNFLGTFWIVKFSITYHLVCWKLLNSSLKLLKKKIFSFFYLRRV